MGIGKKIVGLSVKQKPLAHAIVVVLVAAGPLGAVLLTSGCGHKAQTPATSTSRPASKTTAPKSKPVNPLIGVGSPPSGPVIAVKIDDTANGRPQVGIDKADVVYIEQAEGGLTRLVAVYATNKPTTVGYVRSVRTSDPELLSQYGRIILVAAGGGGDSIPTLKASILHPYLSGPAMSKVDSREPPYSTVINLAQVSKSVTADSARNIGWTFAVDAPAGGQPAPGIRTAVGSTPVEFVWDAKLSRYVRVIDGVRQHAADGAPVTAQNVIVQYCKVTVHPGDVDVLGNPAQYTHSIGNGKVVVFRNGTQYPGTWSRSSLTSGTMLKDARGKQIPLAPGDTWVVLVSTKTPLATH